MKLLELSLSDEVVTFAIPRLDATDGGSKATLATDTPFFWTEEWLSDDDNDNDQNVAIFLCERGGVKQLLQFHHRKMKKKLILVTAKFW